MVRPASNGHSALHAPSPGPVSGSRGALAVLVVGDKADTVRTAMPTARVEVADDWFDAIARLSRRAFDAVLAPTAPVARRPEAATRRLRDAAGTARLLLLADATTESLSRRLVTSGHADDYLATPLTPTDLAHALDTSPTTTEPLPAAQSAVPPHTPDLRHPTSDIAPRASDISHRTSDIPIADIVLDVLVREPDTCVSAAVRELNARLPAGLRLELTLATDRDPDAAPGQVVLSRLVPSAGTDTPDPAQQRVLHAHASRALGEHAGALLLDQITPHFSRLLELQDRHARLTRVAFTDELTGLSNARYFKHFLEKTLRRAREQRFPVTLLLFDIDNFKKYNDTFGHAVGDEILRQTGQMMTKCVRAHDLVARLGGDEFAVVFWEKEGPRQPLTKDGLPSQTLPPTAHRPPQSPVQIFQRFKRRVEDHDFAALGSSGKGTLTISGGLAVYPYDARNADELLDAADKALMFGAKKSGKNCLHLVGDTPPPPATLPSGR